MDWRLAQEPRAIRCCWAAKHKGLCQVWAVQVGYGISFFKSGRSNEAFVSLRLVWVVFLPEVGAYTIYVRRKINDCFGKHGSCVK